MQIFLDTANLNEIRQAVEWGAIEGVTTNPSLVSREGGDFYSMVREICEVVKGPVSAEVISLESGEMVKEARHLSSLASNVVVKIPVTLEGLRAVNILEKEGIRTNVTLVFSVNQALLAANAGASFISPFLGRLDDIGESGVALVEDLLEVYNQYNYKTRLISASIRHPRHVVEVARAGSHIATLPFKVLKQMIDHPLTEKGIKRFLEDWEKSKKLS